MAFDVLRKGKGVEILLILQRGAMGIREIQRAIGGSYKTIYERIKDLLEDGLVVEEYLTNELYGKRPYDMRLIRLTEKGRELAKSIVGSGFARPLLLRKFRERWIIAILSILKTVPGKTRLMKLLFILKNETRFTKRELAGFYQFRAGKFGPFSRGVENDLEELRDDGFIKFEIKPVLPREFNEEGKYLHIYELAQEQSDVIQETLENLPHDTLQKLERLGIFNKMSLIELLEHVYKNYPDYIKKSIIVERILQKRV